MKLSAAIRTGAKKRPQQFENGFFRKDYRGRICSCALGAPWEAVTGKTSFETGEFLYNYFPEIWDAAQHPVTNEQSELFKVAADLNDRQKWSREKIANFVESLGY